MKQCCSSFFFVSTRNKQQMSLLHTKQFNVPLRLKRELMCYWNPNNVARVCCLDRDKIIAAHEILSIALNLQQCGHKSFFYYYYYYCVFHSFCILCSFKLTLSLRNFLPSISGCLQMTIFKENH